MRKLNGFEKVGGLVQVGPELWLTLTTFGGWYISDDQENWVRISREVAEAIIPKAA